MDGKLATLTGAIALAIASAAQPAASAAPIGDAQASSPQLIEAQYVRPYYRHHHHSWGGWGWRHHHHYWGRPHHHHW